MKHETIEKNVGLLLLLILSVAATVVLWRGEETATGSVASPQFAVVERAAGAGAVLVVDR